MRSLFLHEAGITARTHFTFTSVPCPDLNSDVSCESLKDHGITKPLRLEKPSKTIESSPAKATTKPHPEPKPPNSQLQRPCFPALSQGPRAPWYSHSPWGHTTNPKISTAAFSSSSHSTDRTCGFSLPPAPVLFSQLSLWDFCSSQQRETLCSPARELLFPSGS